VPTVLDLTRSLSPDAFAHSVAAMRGARRYTALVPAQLIRILDAGGAAEAALASLDAVLVGGAALPPTVRDRAGGAGARIVTTYGMTETCGGCVYDGRPLDGVTPRLADDGRIELAGPVLARGYLDGAAATPGEGGGPAPFVTDADGLRWLRTGDVGRWNGERLVVLGRADDAITTGGLTISPHAVEHAVLTLPEIAEAVVVGLPDRVWGQRVVAAVVLRPGALPPSLERVRRAVTEALEPGAAPRDVVVLDALPVRGVGKHDREAVAERLRRSR
jgi:O-succinylbenzoic acid--CoA ligase